MYFLLSKYNIFSYIYCFVFSPRRIAKKMLLAQIKSNYSSGAESSSDNEGADKDEKSSKKVKKEDDDEEEQQGSIHLLNIPSCFQISLFYCVSSQTVCFSL